MDQPPPPIARNQEGCGPPGFGDRRHNMANYHFSPEELRALRECNTESFFQRSLPLGIGFGVMAYFGVQNGYLKRNAKFGAIPKVLVGVLVGYFMGKFSYQQKCVEKLMRLPNSQLAEMLRERRQAGKFLAPDPSLGLSLSPFMPSGDVYSDENARDHNRSTSLNLDVESRPTFSGLDDTYRPSLDTPSVYLEPELPIEPAKPGTTYEDLRNKNRDDYLKKQQSPYSRPLPSEAPVIFRQNELQKPAPSGEAPPQAGSTNKYGDTWTR